MEIVVSSIGVVSPWGRGLKPFVEGYKERRCVLQKSEALRALPNSYIGKADDIDFRRYLKRRKAAKLMTPAARMALDAAGQVMENYQDERSELALFVSVGREPPDEGEAEESLVAACKEGKFSETLLASKGRDLYPPLLPLKTLPNMILAHISIHLNICGENGAWAGNGVRAFVEGYHCVREGTAPAALVGASDSLIDLGNSRDLCRLGLRESSGQAAVMFLLESKERALLMGRKVIAKISHNDNSKQYNELLPLIGNCGVAMPMLNLLANLSYGTAEWNGYHFEVMG